MEEEEGLRRIIENCKQGIEHGFTYIQVYTLTVLLFSFAQE